MADVVVDGREIDFDLSKVSIREYRALFDPKQPNAEEDAIIARVSGLTIEEYLELSLLDMKRIWKEFYKKVRDPLADPN